MSDTEHEYFDDFYDCDVCQSRHRVGVVCPAIDPLSLMSEITSLEGVVSSHVARVNELTLERDRLRELLKRWVAAIGEPVELCLESSIDLYEIEDPKLLDDTRKELGQ